MNYGPIDHDLFVSPAAEKAIARELTPSVALPTLILAVVLPSLLALIVFAGFSRAPLVSPALPSRQEELEQ